MLTPELSDGGTKTLRLQLRRNPAVRWSDLVSRRINDNQKSNMPTDVTRSTMPPSNAVTWYDHASEMLARFPGVNHTELLTQLTASYLMDFKYGNKREERAACDFLNLLQAEAIKLRPAPAEPANNKMSHE